MDSVLSAFLRSALCLLLCLPGRPRLTSRRYLLGGALVAATFSPYALTRLLHAALGQPDVLPSPLNWTGQLLLLLVSLLLMAVLVGTARWSWVEFGMQLRFRPGTGRDLARYLLPLLLAEAVALWALVPGGPVSAEYLAFQFTAPGLTEELLMRGLLLAVLDRAFTGRVRVLGAELGWGAVVSSLVFGAAHGLRVSPELHLGFLLAPAAIPTVGGFVLAWCRARSGNLLLPIAVHSGMNGLQQLLMLLKA